MMNMCNSYLLLYPKPILLPNWHTKCLGKHAPVRGGNINLS